MLSGLAPFDLYPDKHCWGFSLPENTKHPAPNLSASGLLAVLVGPSGLRYTPENLGPLLRRSRAPPSAR